MADILFSELTQMPIALLSGLLALVYIYLRRRDSRSADKARQNRRTAPRIARPSSKVQRRSARQQREQLIDLHLRGGIFLTTSAGQIEGYTISELGEVQVEGGAGHEARLQRAAAQRWGQANALINMHQVPADQRNLAGTAASSPPGATSKQGPIWRATAVLAHPLDPDLCPPDGYRKDLVLVDGSNVMHWECDAGLADLPSLRPVTLVLAALKSRGVAAGVVFDATAGHLLEGRFLDHDDLAARLPTAADVLVVHKGTQADWVLLDMAREEGLVIISNDHFRDAPTARHLLKQKGYVEAGRVRLLEPRP